MALEKQPLFDLVRTYTAFDTPAGYEKYQQWLAGTQLEKQPSLSDYSVSNRGLKSGLTGTPDQAAQRVAAFDAVGMNFLMPQGSPQLEEIQRFSESVIRVLV